MGRSMVWEVKLGISHVSGRVDKRKDSSGYSLLDTGRVHVPRIEKAHVLSLITHGTQYQNWKKTENFELSGHQEGVICLWRIVYIGCLWILHKLGFWIKSRWNLNHYGEKNGFSSREDMPTYSTHLRYHSIHLKNIQYITHNSHLLHINGNIIHLSLHTFT